MKVLAIIPAREGSKRVPQKNFRAFADTTLVDLTIKQAQESSLITLCVVSSDSQNVLDIASQYSDIIALKRPLEFSNDLSPAIDYVRHALKKCESNVSPFDMVVILQPSSPFRSSSDIDTCIQLLSNHQEASSCVSVVKVEHMVHPVKLKKLNGIKLEPYIEEEAGRFASQELPEVYVRNCAVYATWRKDLEIRNDVIGMHSIAHVMQEFSSIDINTMLDFEFAEHLYRKMK